MTIAYLVVNRKKQPVKVCRWLLIFFRRIDAAEACVQHANVGAHHFVRVLIEPTRLNYHMLKRSAEKMKQQFLETTAGPLNIHPGWPVRKKRRSRGI
jgi:hypothetical protein